MTQTGGFALWQPSPDGSSPGTLLGRRVVIDRNAPVMAAGVRSVGYGDFSKYLVRISSEITVQRLTETYARSAQWGFIATARLGGQLLQTPTASAFVTLQQADS